MSSNDQFCSAESTKSNQMIIGNDVYRSIVVDVVSLKWTIFVAPFWRISGPNDLLRGIKAASNCKITDFTVAYERFAIKQLLYCFPLVEKEKRSVNPRELTPFDGMEVTSSAASLLSLLHDL